ncbi:MAG: hypothetical protein J0H89_08745 [Rhizobiales bacterium]|nr:hypothetical protein [Hyphomicrobiales bacterium]
MSSNLPSRNLALTLVASVAVIALLTVASRECLDGQCSFPGLPEHPTPVMPAAVAQASSQAPEKPATDTAKPAREVVASIPTAPVVAAPAAAVPPAEAAHQNKIALAASAPSVSVQPQHDANPAVAVAMPALLRPSAVLPPREQAVVGGARIIQVSLAPPREAEQANPTRTARIASPSDPRSMRVASIPPLDETAGLIEGRRASLARVLAARGAAPFYTGYPRGGVVLTGVALDPAWRLCQLGGHGVWQNASLCGPYSYHPYGVYGYRPYGTYVPTNDYPRVSVVAPDAKIVQVRARD